MTYLDVINIELTKEFNLIRINPLCQMDLVY